MTATGFLLILLCLMTMTAVIVLVGRHLKEVQQENRRLNLMAEAVMAKQLQDQTTRQIMAAMRSAARQHRS